MGVVPPEKLKLKRHTCELCGRKFETIQSLGIHRKFVHRIYVSKTAKKVLKAKTNAKMITSPVSAEKNIRTAKKTLFKCPKCIKVFNVYFHAYKHIQKYHCCDINGDVVEPNSSLLIKPIRVESCDSVPTKYLQTNERFMCLGCQKTLDNWELFQDHVKLSHANDVESLFFPSNAEFLAWKTELQAATKTKFATRTPEKQLRQMYHCSHQPSLKGHNKTFLCPSALSVTEFKNGQQVFYYKEHCGHPCSELSTVKFKKYCISPHLMKPEIKNFDTDKNIYEQFKIIMNNITETTANVDIGMLNMLLGKALEMAILLNSNIQIEEQSVVTKNMTDDQISQVLAEVKTYSNKRKVDAINTFSKKIKPDLEGTANSKIDSPSNISIFDSLNLLPSIHLQRSGLQSPPSFNDSYKDFVDQNCKPVGFDSKRNISSSQRRNTSETPKINKETNGNTLEKLKEETLDTSKDDTDISKVDTLDILKGDTLDTQKRKTLDKQKGDTLDTQKVDTLDTQKGNTLDTQKGKTLDTQKGKTLDAHKGNTLGTPKRSSVKKKLIMKTKMGQFKPNISPKESNLLLPKSSPKKSKTHIPSKVSKSEISPQTNISSKTRKKTVLTPNTSKTTPRHPIGLKYIPDIKYEVKEQENDCNILILKI